MLGCHQGIQKLAEVLLKALIPLVALCSTAVLADEGSSIHPYLDATHIFSFGGALQEADAKIGATLTGRPGQTVDFGEIGLDETYGSGYLEYRYSFSRRWQLVASAQTFRSDGKREASTEIEFGDQTFPVGAQIKSSLTIDTYFVDLLYKVYRSDRAAIWLGGGLHFFDFDAELSARLTVGDESNTSQGDSSELLAPLPNLRAQAFYAFDEKWAVYGVLGWLSADIDEWSGSFTYLHTKAHYRFTERFGVALGYQFTDVNVSRDRTNLETEFDIQFTGPSAQITYAF